MALVLDNPQRVADWVGAYMGHTAPSVDAAIGYEVNGELKAGVYFDCMTDNNIFAHIASAAHAPVSMLEAVARYVFEQLKLSRLSFPVPANNFKTRKFVTDMGCYEEARLHRAAGAHDVIVYVMWSDDSFVLRLLSRRSR